MGPWEMKGVCAVTWLRVYYYAQTRGHPSPCEEERPQKPHEDQFKRDINEENHNKQKADVIIKSGKQSTKRRLLSSSIQSTQHIDPEQEINITSLTLLEFSNHYILKHHHKSNS